MAQGAQTHGSASYALTPGFVARQAGGFRWRVRADVCSRLLTPNGLPLKDWLASGAATLIKQGPHRQVYRLELPGLICYIKHNLVPDLATRTRLLLFQTKARKEFHLARKVAERGIATYQVLAVGETKGILGGESFLITRNLEETEQLNLFLLQTLPAMPPAEQARWRQRLARDLGAWVAALHEAGVAHRDFHLANILIRRDGEALSFFLIDLDHVRLRGPLNWRQSRDNLIVLNRWFLVHASRPDRLRFWNSYYATRYSKGKAPGLCASLGCDLERRTWKSCMRFWRSRERRCFKSNRYYQPVKASGLAGYAVRDLDAGLLQNLLENPDAPFQREGIKVLKASRKSQVIELKWNAGGQTRTYIYKKILVASWRSSLAALVRSTGAVRSWQNAHVLRDTGLPTPRPLVLLQRTSWGMVFDGYVLMEKIEQARSLYHEVHDLGPLPPLRRRQGLLNLLEPMAKLIRELHRRNISHRDLKAANILVSQETMYPSPAPCSQNNAGVFPCFPANIWLIDLVGVERPRRLTFLLKVQNLARLNVSFINNPVLTRTDRLRFLRIYLLWGLWGRNDWKTWWRAIQAASQAKIKKNERRGRPLG